MSRRSSRRSASGSGRRRDAFDARFAAVYEAHDLTLENIRLADAKAVPILVFKSAVMALMGQDCLIVDLQDHIARRASPPPAGSRRGSAGSLGREPAGMRRWEGAVATPCIATVPGQERLTRTAS